jgi:hypothetical protein
VTTHVYTVLDELSEHFEFPYLLISLLPKQELRGNAFTMAAKAQDFDNLSSTPFLSLSL